MRTVPPPRPRNNAFGQGSRLVDHSGQEVAPGRMVIRQKIGQNDLAAMAGIARENLTRVLNDWRNKVLSRLSGYYCLEDKAQLKHQVKL